ncbi:MAG: DUF167 domain-containing protein [Candidatus Omnitrophica bacterium]|nr:DUF167 domain-containing protein [Candidatus Omnitrophota bacterium]
MKISVIVKPYSHRAKVVRTPTGLIVYVDAAPVEGKANKRLLEICASYLGVARSRIRISHGNSGRKKILEIT